MSDFAIVSVWYHKNEFIYNTTRCPFWHNILYHSQFYKYYVIYYLEDDSFFNTLNVGPVKFINFKNFEASKNIARLKRAANKIDYIKLHVVLNSDIVPETHLLLMDMDCQIQSTGVDMKRLQNNKYRLTPYTDPSVPTLYFDLSYDDEMISFNSYLENYAVLINKTRKFFKNYHTVSVRIEGETNDHFMFAQYLQIIQLYFCIFHQYALPPLVKEYNIKDVIPLKFNRGGSYFKHKMEYVYEFNFREPAVFNSPTLTYQLYMELISNKNEEKIKTLLHELRRLKYDFNSEFVWSNSLQCDVNVCGCIEDRVKNFNYDEVEFVKPLKMFNVKPNHKTLKDYYK